MCASDVPQRFCRIEIFLPNIRIDRLSRSAVRAACRSWSITGVTSSDKSGTPNRASDSITSAPACNCWTIAPMSRTRLFISTMNQNDPAPSPLLTRRMKSGRRASPANELHLSQSTATIRCRKDRLMASVQFALRISVETQSRLQSSWSPRSPWRTITGWSYSAALLRCGDSR